MRISDWSSDVCSSDLAAFEPATVRLHVDAQDGTDVVRQGQGEGHQPSPSSGSWSLTTSRPSTTRAGPTSLRRPPIVKPHRLSASPTLSGFTPMTKSATHQQTPLTWIS